MTMDGSTIKSRIRSIIRARSIKPKRNKPEAKENLLNKVTLERVLGITTSGSSGLACHPHSGLVAYPAGCVVVLLNPSRNTQQLINTSRKSITTLAFSSDGKYLVTGESGHLPAVRVWDVSERKQVAELQEHKYGVSCVSFSPNSKYIVSVGYQHDMILNVWAWKKNTVVASNKVSSEVTAVSFSEDSSYFVTAGNRHVKFWYLEPSNSTKVTAPIPLLGHNGLLGELRNNFFCDVACGRGRKSKSTFCITSSGLLCEFNERRKLDKWLDLKTSVAKSLSVTEGLIFCACADGTVHVLSPVDLRFICTLPRPHHLGTDVAAVTQASHLFSNKLGVRYPDAVAVTYDPVNRWLSCVYDDHSLYVWDVRDLQRVGKVHSALYHSACVWDLQMYPEDTDGSESSGAFLTCSADNTVRLWSSNGHDYASRANVLSNDLIKVIYMDGNTATLLDNEGTAMANADKADGKTVETRSGIRTICVSPDGKHLASGDRSGMLRIHDLSTMEEILKVEAHDSEILCLEYSKPETGLKLLATASRDRLIHVLDVEEDYGLMQTLDEHSSSITAVRFAASEGKVRMISCGMDKSVYFRTAQTNIRGTKFKHTHHVVRKTSLYDLVVDPTSKYAAVGCQDRSISVFNINSGKQKKSYKGSQTEDGILLEVQTDPSGLYLATSCSDKNLSLFDFHSGECVATMFGHSEIATGIKFTNNCRHLISVSGDSCIFVWRLAPELTINMREKLSQLKRAQNVQPCKSSTLRRCCVSSPEINSGPSPVPLSFESEKEEEGKGFDEEKGRDVQEEISQHTSSESSAGEYLGCIQGPAELGLPSLVITAASDEENDRDSVKDQSGGARPSESPLAKTPPRPRRSWSRCREPKVKSMLELRQLERFSRPGSLKRSPGGQLNAQERGSTSSLQGALELVGQVKMGRPRNHSVWLCPTTAPEPEGVVLYLEQCPSRSSLPGTDYLVRGQDAQCQDNYSQDSTCSVGYCSGGSSLVQGHGDSDSPDPLSTDEECSDLEEKEDDEKEKMSGKQLYAEEHLREHFETLSDFGSPGNRTRIQGRCTPSDSISACFLAHDSTDRAGVAGKAPQERGAPGPQHSRMGKSPAGLRTSQSVPNVATEARRRLAPSHLRREARVPHLLQLPQERGDFRAHSPQPWDSPSASHAIKAHTYMSPTTSSMAKITCSVSVGEGLDMGLPASGSSHLYPSATCPAFAFPGSSAFATVKPGSGVPHTLPPKALKLHLSTDTASPHADQPDKSSLVANGNADPLGDPFCVLADHPLHPDNMCSQGPFPPLPVSLPVAMAGLNPRKFSGPLEQSPRSHEPSVTVETCREVAMELCNSVRKATQLYRMVNASVWDGVAECVEMEHVLAEALLLVRSEIEALLRPAAPAVG